MLKARPRYIGRVKWALAYRRDSGSDPEYSWLGWQWYCGPSRWVQRVWNALPLVVLALILWRVW